ncbi:hypothetical protein VTO42DRAFT_3303 [Malbranchea cinnamomea]
MSRTSSDEQLNFLIKCVKHSNNGKVDFQAVADECGIVSKGAAAKRYERLLKSNGVNPNGGGSATTDGESPTKSTTVTPKKTPTKTPTKSKGGGVGAVAGADGDDSQTGTGTPKKRRGGKTLTKTPSKKKAKSEEKVAELDSEGASDDIVKKEEGLRGINDPFLTQPGDKLNGDDAMFKQFCNTAAAAASAEVENRGHGGPTEEMVSIKDEYA